VKLYNNGMQPDFTEFCLQQNALRTINPRLSLVQNVESEFDL